MFDRNAFATLAFTTAFVGPSFATDIVLQADGQWQQFSVDSYAAPSFGTGWIDDADGSPLTFSFDITTGSVGRLTVVDGGFAGDIFAVTNFGQAIGSTSSVAVGSYEASANLGYDFDAALLDASFSRGIFTLSAGGYRIGGSLLQSVTLAGQPLNATAGGLSLSVSAVPEPSTAASLMAGLVGIGLLLRRRA